MLKERMPYLRMHVGMMVLKGRKSRVRDETRPMAPKPDHGWRSDFRFCGWGQPRGAFEKKGPSSVLSNLSPLCVAVCDMEAKHAVINSYF